MSQAELARLLQAEGGGWRKSKVATLESGGRESLALDELVQLAAALGAKWSELLAGSADLSLGAGGAFVRAAELRASLVEDRSPATVLDSAEAVEAFLAGAVQHDRADPFGMHLAAKLRAPQPAIDGAARTLYGKTATEERETRVRAFGELSARDTAYRRRDISPAIERQIADHLREQQ